LAHIIGFTGKRGVGKSIAAKILQRNGYIGIHAFTPGKVATRAYFRHLGFTEFQAQEMTDGKLKDVHSEFLPDNQSPRFFMEKFGRFMGVDMGAEWTLGVELKRELDLNPKVRLVAESIVYEADCLRQYGGKIVRIERPGFYGPAGMRTDEAESKIVVDFTIQNNGTIEQLESKILDLVAQIY
jgi:hypothetical protein